MRCAPPAVSTAVLALALSSPAHAGPLAETARGVDNKVDTHTSNDSAPPPSSDPDPTPSPDYDDHVCTTCNSSAVVVGAGSTAYYAHGTTTVAEEQAAREPILTGPGRLDLYLGGHAVVDSDSAMIGELRASKDWIGLAVAGIRYVEHVEEGKREDDVSLYLTTFNIAGRVFRWDTTELWLEGGLGVSGSSEYSTLLGTNAALRAEHGITPDLGLRAQARYYALEHDVSAFEAWGGVRAWFLQAGYRALKFNVGPPLHGPEAGISLRF